MAWTEKEDKELLIARAQLPKPIGWKRLVVILGRPKTTIIDRHQKLMSEPIEEDQPDTDIQTQTVDNGGKISDPNPTPLSINPLFDWEKELDNMGKAVLVLFAKAVKSGDQDDMKDYINSFVRAFKAKTGAIRVYQDNRVQVVSLDNPEVRQLLEIEMKAKAREFIEQMEIEMDEFKDQQRSDWNITLAEIEDEHNISIDKWRK